MVRVVRVVKVVKVVKERMDLLELLRKGGMDGDVDFLREALRVLVEEIMEADVSSRTAMMNTGPPRPGSDPFEDWHDAFNRICRLESRWRRKCLWHGEQ